MPRIPAFLLALMLAGLAATGGQFSITAAYSHAPAREVSVFDYSQILFATLLGILFLGEALTVHTALGMLLIMVGILLVVRPRREISKTRLFVNKRKREK